MIVAEIEQKLVIETFLQWEKQLGEPLTDKLKQVIRILAIVQIEEHIPAVRRTGRGRFPHDRRLLTPAFVVKAAYNAPTTQALLEMLHTQPMLRRICGFETRERVPSKATFSRSFTAFAKDELGDKIHRSLIASYIGDRLMFQTAERVTSLYDLMDSAYDATPIREVSLELGHQPLLDRNRRRAEVIPFAPTEAERYKQRSACERVNSRLKDEFGGRQVRVRGTKYTCILFEIVALFNYQLFKIALW